jgi:putative ABC transport system ATP-binding protein
MIQVTQLHKSYPMGRRRLEVLKGIDLAIASGEFVAVMGASGSGKSTLLNILGLLDTYDCGEYRLNGERIWELSEKRAARLRNRHLGFVFQSFNLIPFKNAMENVALPLFYQKVGKKKRNAIAMQFLEQMGLADWALHLPSELSGGQKQRVAIARALITRPAVILADEPTGALDSATSREVLEVLRGINQKGITIVVITHETEIAAMTDRVVRIRDGVIFPEDVNDGVNDDVLADEDGLVRLDKVPPGEAV